MKAIVEISTKWAYGAVPILELKVIEGGDLIESLTIEANGLKPIVIAGRDLNNSTLGVADLVNLNIRKLEVKPVLVGNADFELRGDLARVLAVSDEGSFSRILQIPTSRVKERLALFLGALVNLDRFAGTETEFACRTILIHRMLEEPALVNHFDANKQLDVFLASSAKLLASYPMFVLDTAIWSTVRWCCSLSMVIGYLQLARENYEGAYKCFNYSASCLPHVSRSKVSALNVIQASFFSGLIGAYLNKAGEAEHWLKQAVLGLQQVVASQDLMDNVWVVGDLINVAKVSRHAYIALGLLGFVSNSPEVTRIDTKSKVSLGVVDGPMLNLVHAGRMPKFTAYISQVNGEAANAPQ